MSRWPAPTRLVVWLPASLGDAVHATPALEALREALPHTSIVWAGRRAPHEALAGLDARHAVLPLEGPPRRGPAAAHGAARLLRRVGADAIVLFEDAVGAAAAARGAGIPRRTGTALTWARRRLVNDAVDVPAEAGRLLPRARAQHFLDLVRPFGVTDPEPRAPRVVVEAFDAERAARRLAGCGLDAGAGWLVVAPGATGLATARMPAARLADAVRAVRATHGLVPVVAVGPGEEVEGRDLAEAIAAPCVDLSARPPDVGELKGLLQRARLVLAADAGPRRLAEALGVPTVVFAGPTDLVLMGPSRATLVRRDDLGCLGCRAAPCPLEHHACLSGLDPRRLADAVGAALDASTC
ncbi:MAG: glycosyltransferase family 9 protein [Planctomycetota bacterium]